MRLQSYRFRLKTAVETFEQQNLKSNSNNLFFYFKGERGLTQSLSIPLSKLHEEIYESTLELIDVGNLTLLHVKLDANNAVRWKLDWIELERDDDKTVLNFPIHRWLDSNRNQKLDVMIKEGPTQLAPIYTIIIRTGTISSCLQAKVYLALIGDGASTLPFDLNSNSNLIQCTTKDLFQPGSNDRFCISPLEAVDIGRLFHLQLWCDSDDRLPYYCESIEVINNLNNDKYFFLVNHWFGPNLEQFVSVPTVNRNEESNVYTIAIKTADISDSNEETMVYIHMKFANGKSYTDALSLSETHQVAFQKDNTDFFMVNIDDVGNVEIVTVKICLVNKTPTPIQWNCAWIEIRDIFYQRSYCYIPPKTFVSVIDKEPYDYTTLARIIDLPCSKNNT